FAQIPASPPFVPVLSSAPTDFTVAIDWNDPLKGLTSPTAIAIGKMILAALPPPTPIWDCTFSGNSGPANSITLYNSFGSGITEVATLNAGNGIDKVAVDTSGDLW